MNDTFEPQVRRRRRLFPDGHFYSPVVDIDEVSSRCHAIWPAHPTVAGIDFNDDMQREFLTKHFPRFIPEFDYPELLEDGSAESDMGRFFIQNSQFGWLDARTLFVMLRTWRPQRIIEVGSGFSSLLIADVNTRWFDNQIHFTCIEPYPRAFLTVERPGISRLIETQVQNVAISEFETLQDGDILFIDSSHVSKTGSDVNFLYLQVLPRINKGVHIHIHDIFLPHDYPPDWVIAERRSWNEQYILQAMLMFSAGFRVEFGCNYAFSTFPELVREALALPDRSAFGGGSFWITKTC
jgi:hypothetical protein